ncbi:hypothetical protein CANCADRAFT_21394 [Tortispora caseinolytica NRRL Y-17796]|uniref:Membrane protein TMS1 n=1 Tax=Tortispora caseinolytica NRRL Y-17796 TaxID=767744 RepID=A0A1E4TLJ0_9ASCO|nr:hypothetical protein CANCADRAFT_21394 [Tortispora caseinolytica NRRL Y-17796]
MGALLSVPMMGASAITSAVGSCVGAAACTAMGSACGTISSSVSTRIAYAILFILNSAISWIMLTPYIVHKLEKLSFNFLKITCFGEQCTGFVAVHRVNFALAVFHFLLALLLIGVRSSRDRRSVIQNGLWPLKVILWIAFVVLTFLIPEGFFVWWGNYIALICTYLFVFLGLVLLVSAAHSWAETCILHIEEDDSTLWKVILVGSTAGMYAGSLTMTIIMYIFFAGSGCSMNQAAITINLLLCIIVSAMSVHPTVQEYNPSAGLSQASLVAVYGSYLTMSAVASEPDDKMCNPIVRSAGARTASIVIGALFTFFAIAYTTTTAATQTASMGSYQALPTDDEHQMVTHEPSRHEMRQEAIRSAVESGALPASALDDYAQSESDDDEHSSTQYNYTIFHFIFLLATQYVATLLTMNVHEDQLGDFNPVGRTYFSSWLKIISAWICFCLYAWSLIAPVVMPDRFSYV